MNNEQIHLANKPRKPQQLSEKESEVLWRQLESLLSRRIWLIQGSKTEDNSSFIGNILTQENEIREKFVFNLKNWNVLFV